MKLHLPKGLRSAVLACMAVVTGFATTVGTGIVVGGVMTIAFAGNQAMATEYTNPEDLTAITFANGDVLNLGDGATVSAPLTLDNADSSITLNVTDGTVTWATTQGKYSEGNNAAGSVSDGVSVVNVKSGATLDVTTGESRFCVFACKDGSAVTINLEAAEAGKAGAKMQSKNIFGWENSADGYGTRVVNMGAGSEWTINANTNFYLNNTAINLGGGKIVLDENATMWFERRQNSISTTAEATQMSIISGSGLIKAGNNASEDGGYIFNVARGTFAIDGTNTADLLVSAKLSNADNAHAFQKTGDGVMQITSDSTAFGHSFFVRAGELKFTGAGNMDSSNMSVESGATLTLNTTAEFTSKVNVQAGGTLVLDSGQKIADNVLVLGNLALTDAVTLKGGTFTFNKTAVIDLTGWTGGGTYQLFTLDGGSVASSRVSVNGAAATGTWYVGSDGALYDKGLVTWSSGSSLTWAVGAKFDGDVAYANGGLVDFAGNQGDVTATLEGELSSIELLIDEGTNLILAGTGTLATEKTYVNGDITFKNTGNSLGAVQVGAGGNVVIAAGGEVTLSSVAGTTNFNACSFIIDGNTTLGITGGSFDNKVLTIESGSTVNVSGSAYLGKNITIKGTMNIGKSDALNYGATQTIKVDGGTLAMGANRATLGTNNRLVLNNGIVTGTGDQHGALDFYQNGGSITSTGTSAINAPVRLRDANHTTTVDVADGTLTVSSFCNIGSGASGNLLKDGVGTLAISTALNTLGTVNVAEGTLKMLGGSSATSAVTLNGGALAAAGTATMTSLSGAGNITVDAAGALTIGAASGQFNKLGTGALTITALDAGGCFATKHEGALAIGTLTAEVISYADVANDIAIDNLGGKTYIDVIALEDSLSSGVKLGIQATDANRAFIDVVAMDAGTWELGTYSVGGVDYFKLQGVSGGSLKLTSDWDMNWGGEGLAGVPTSLTEVKSADNIIGNTGYKSADGVVAIMLGDNGKTKDNVARGDTDNPKGVFGGAYDVGGAAGTTEVATVWIDARAGAYGAIVGGNMAGNWNGSSASSFAGDTHIQINDDSTDTVDLYAGLVVGGNFADGEDTNDLGARFTGDTYISVYTDSVGGTIIGGSSAYHGAVSYFTGDTNVFVYTPLGEDGTSYRNEGPNDAQDTRGNYLVGASFTNGGTHNFSGSANVTIDLTDYKGATDKTFDKKIVGGFLMNGGTATMTNGDINVSITGSTSGGSAITFADAVVGGSFLKGSATSTVGDVSLTIANGTFESVVAGGSYHNSQGSSTTDNVTIDISGGTFNGLVLGGSDLEGEAGTMIVGTVDVDISGDSTKLVGDLVGGFNIKGTGTSNVTANVGDITLSLTGGTVTNVYGGSHSLRNADSTVNQGDIVIDLQGGKVTGDVYAGGWQEGSTKLATESTLVKIDSDVTLTDGKIISAGYKTDKTNSTIAGDKAILFIGDADQDRSGMNLIDFNMIGVETAGKTATIGAVTTDEAVTINGAGIIKLGSDTNTYNGGLTVAQKATLAMNGKSITGTLTIEDGATVNGVASATDIAVGTYTNSQGMQATGDITVGTSLSSSANITAGKITGAGAVTITGGTVTLSDTTDAFANSGATGISGADLAGTWNADGVTIGADTTVSGTIGLADSTINSTIENTGSIALSGSITVGVEGVIGESLYTHNGIKAEVGNGYRSGVTDYQLVTGGTITADGVENWFDDKGAAFDGSADFSNGKLTVATDEDKSAYWVNTGTVSYDGSAATWNSTTETLATGAVVKLNGGMLQLTGSIEAAASIAVETTGTIDVNDHTLNQSAISGTGAEISGTGTYNLGDDTALSVGLATGWTGTVYKSVIDEASADISSYANANSMIAVDRVLCSKLVVDTGSLTINESLTIQAIMKAGARSGATSPLTDCLAVAGELAGDFDLVISDALLNTVLGVGESSGQVVLGTVGSKAADLAITLNGSGKYDLGDSSYTLGWQEADGKQQLVLEASIKGSEWIGAGDTALWISEETCVDAFGTGAEVLAGMAWKGSEEPSADNGNANFLGEGDSEVTIYGTVTPAHLRVDTTGSYTIKGNSIIGSDVEPELAATGRLNLLTGTLNIEIGKASFAGRGENGELMTSVVAAGTELNIGNSLQKSDVSIHGGLEIAGDATIANLSQLTVTEGDVTVTGTLTVEGDRTVNNGIPDYSKRGTLVADSLTNAGGKVTVNGGVVQIGSAVATADADPEPLFTNSGTYEVKGGGLTTVLGDAENSGTLTLTDGTINITGNLDSTGGTLTLTKGDMTVGGELSGVDFDTIGSDVKLSVGQYEDSTGLAIEGALTVTGESAIGSAITLGETGSLAVDGGSLTTGELKFGELTAESDAKVALSNGGSIGAPAITTFTTGAADGVLITLDNAADGLVDGDSFRLVDGEDDAAGYRLADEYEQTVLLNTLKAELLTDAEGMYLGVREQTADELVWNTSEDDSEGGLHIINDSDAPYHGYRTLDTILTVNVDADRTIDLSSIAPDDADDSLLINELTGSETLTITGNGDDRVTINGGEMTGGLDIAGVDLQATDLTVGTLTGTTSAATTIGGDITVTKSANYIGGYDAATITVTDGAVASLKTGTGLTVAGDNGSITLNYDSDATINAIETTGADVNLAGAPDNKLTLAENSTMKGGSLNFDVKSNALGAEIIGGTLALTGTAVNVAQADDSLVIAGVGSDTTVIASLGDTTGGDVTLTGAGFDKYFTNVRMVNGNVVADRRTDYVKDSIAATSTNGHAGVTLLDDSLVNVNPQANRDKYATQAALLDAVDAGRMTDEDAAAVAGASVATLGMALSGDVERQLRAIRNRTTSMGVNECVVNEGMPYFNAWVNAEGNRGQLDKDGTLAGYSLDSWGGTVGFDVDFNPHFTAGLAITAMYGNLTADGPEAKAEGDMDTYYVTLFARYAEAAWTHTFVGTIGKMDGTFDRTVNAGGVAYETEGSTDGMAFGLMYEVGYVMPLNEDATACMQPIFNVSLRHSNVGSYTEEGSDAGLEVGSQSMTVLTFGLGARMQAVVGESLYNRASIFEARALAKVDVGDRSSEADVAFIDGANGATVESAELGAFGVELGAGLTIPVGDDDGSIFIDGSVELRSGYTNVNGTVGYRINF